MSFGSGGPNRMNMNRTGIETSVSEGIITPSAKRTKAAVLFFKKSTEPTNTVVASAPVGIRFSILSFWALFTMSSVDDKYVSSFMSIFVWFLSRSMKDRLLLFKLLNLGIECISWLDKVLFILDFPSSLRFWKPK